MGIADHAKKVEISENLEAVAPIRIKSTLSKQKTPWRNTTTVKNRKRECRKAERKWRKTKLQIHYELYKQSLRSYNNELCKARQLHLSEMINKNVNNYILLYINTLINLAQISKNTFQAYIFT